MGYRGKIGGGGLAQGILEINAISAKIPDLAIVGGPLRTDIGTSGGRLACGSASQ